MSNPKNHILTPTEARVLQQYPGPEPVGLIKVIEGDLLPPTELEDARDVARELLAFLEIYMPGVTEANVERIPWLGEPMSSWHRNKAKAIEGNAPLVVVEKRL